METAMPHLIEEMSLAIDEGAIPPRPVVMERVVSELSMPDPDFRVIEREIIRDVAIAAALVKTVNSPFFGMRKKVGTIRDALVVMGARNTAQAVACASLRAAFPALKLDRFWDSAEIVAGHASTLASKLRRLGVSPETAYTYGLFRDCGIAVLALRIPDYLSTLATANADPSGSFIRHEILRHRTSHNRVGAMMANSWALPAEIVEAIEHHHDAAAIRGEPDMGIPPASGALIALAQVGERFHQETSGMSRTCEWDKLGAACLARLGLDEDGLIDFA